MMPKGHGKSSFNKEKVKAGLSREDSLCRSKWLIGLNQITARLRRIRQP